MVSLRNFKRNNDTLECDFYPEAKESNSNRCYIVIDKQTKEIVTYVAPESSICCSMHIVGARAILAKYINKDSFPEVDYCVWG